MNYLPALLSSEGDVLAVFTTVELAERALADYTNDAFDPDSEDLPKAWPIYSDCSLEWVKIFDRPAGTVTVHRLSRVLWDSGPAVKVSESRASGWGLDISPVDDVPSGIQWCRPPMLDGRGGVLRAWGLDADEVQSRFDAAWAVLTAASPSDRQSESWAAGLDL